MKNPLNAKTGALIDYMIATPGLYFGGDSQLRTDAVVPIWSRGGRLFSMTCDMMLLPDRFYGTFVILGGPFQPDDKANVPPAPKRLFDHMAETHKLNLLESELRDIRAAASAEDQETIRRLSNAITIAQGSGNALYQTIVDKIGHHFTPGARELEWDVLPASIAAKMEKDANRILALEDAIDRAVTAFRREAKAAKDINHTLTEAVFLQEERALRFALENKS